MALSDIVSIQVNINQSTVAQQGFGVPLIYAAMPGGDRVLTFNAATWESGMTGAGFSPLSAAYRTARAIMAQSPRPTQFKVGRRTTATAQIVRISPKAAVTNATAYTITVDSPDGTTKTGTFVTASTTTAALITGLASVITTMAVGVTVDGSSGTYVQVTAPADRIYSFSLSSNLKLEDHTAITAGETATDLNAIVTEDNDWYALVVPSSGPAPIKAAADWVETNRSKIFVAQTHDYRALAAADVVNDVVSYVDAQNYERTVVAYNSRAGNFYGAAWVAALLPYEPGQADWKFKLLKGQIADKLTTQEETFLLGKGGSYYEKSVGREMSGAAKGGSGVFLDLIQLKDWFAARVTEGIVNMLTASPTKVAFTDQAAGNSIWGVLKNVIEQAIQNGAVDEDPTTWSVFVPKKRELSAVNITARRWAGCILNATPTSAVHSAGTITVNLNVTA